MKEAFDTALLETETKNGEEKSEINESPKNSLYCGFAIMMALQSSMAPVGLAVGAMNPTMRIMYLFCNETYQSRYNESIPGSTMSLLLGAMVSAIFLGGLVGALTLGLYANLMSRKRCMVVFNLTNITGVALVAIVGYCASSYEAIIAGRFMMGFVSGGGMNMIPMITAETSQKLRISTYLSYIGVVLSASGLVGLILGYPQLLGTEDLWPILMAIPAVPSIVYLLATPWLPQTPYYLLRNGDKTGAYNLLHRLRENEDETIGNELAEIEHELKFVDHNYNATPIKKMISNSGNRKQLMAVVIVFLESQLCGINGVGMYTDQIFTQGGVDKSKVTYASTVVYSVQLLVAMLGSGAINKWGPRKVCIFWSLVMSLSMATLVASMSLVKQYPGTKYLSIVAVTLYVLAWASGPNITLFPLVTALTTDTTREACFKVGGTIFWILSWLISFLPPYLMTSIGQYMFLPYSIFNFLFAIYYIFYIPETHLRKSSEIQEELRRHFPGKKLKYILDNLKSTTV